MGRATLAAILIFVPIVAAYAAVRQDPVNGYYLNIPFDEMTSAQKTAAQQAARTQIIPPLVACASPHNMPLSDRQGKGIENEILQLIAKKLGTTASFFWMPGTHGGMMNELTLLGNCNVLMGVPTGSSRLLETLPLYRTTYVFVSRKASDIHITGFDDPALKTHKLGVVEPSAMRQVLALHGINTGIEVLYQTNRPPWHLGQQVATGKLKIAAIWGPFAAYASFKSAGQLKIQPANLLSNKIPLEYSMTIGVLPGDAVVKYAIDDVLRDSAGQIARILQQYDIPLVKCAECVVDGNLPSHGLYTKSVFAPLQEQFLKPAYASQKDFDPAAARKRIQQELRAGESATQQMFDAMDASENKLVAMLVTHYHADPNALNPQGSLPLGIAADNRDSVMLNTLLAVGANPNLRDENRYTALMYAALRNHVPSIKALLRGHADPDLRGPDQMTALGLAVSEGDYLAARALLEGGADVNAWSDKTHVTPLMLIASKRSSATRTGAVTKGLEPTTLARLMIDKYHAAVGAKSTAGITALMVAAAQDNTPMLELLLQRGARIATRNKAGRTALDIAHQVDADGAVQILRLFKSMSRNTAPSPTVGTGK